MKRTCWQILISGLSFLAVLVPAYGGVSKEIEASYRQQYENKAMFLKIPIRGERQTVNVRGSVASLDLTNFGAPLQFKVGEQIRITKVDFKDSSVEFKVASIDLAREGIVIFNFPASLTFAFDQKDSFESALKTSFTAGLSYDEIDKSKEEFIQTEFERSLRQFSYTTDSSEDFVLRAVSEKNPLYSQIKTQLKSTEQKLSDVEAELTKQRSVGKQAEEELRTLRGEVAEMKRASSGDKEERDRLARERDSLSQQVTQLKEANAKFQTQINSVASKLDLQTDSNAQLGKQVEALSGNIESLSRERTELSKEVTRQKKELEDANKERVSLKQQLQASQREASKLNGDLKALTSNRNSLESNYLRVKTQKESLERAKALEKALVLERSAEQGEEGTVQVSNVRLLSQRIGQLMVQIPERPNQPVRVRFVVDSPDTVQFTEEERVLYEGLGGKIGLKVSFTSWTGGLSPQLVRGDELQKVAPRETAEWVWTMAGDISGTDDVSFFAHLVDVDGNSIFLAQKDFEVGPSNVLSQLTHSLSWISILIGLVLGVTVLGIIVSFRDRSGRVQKKAKTRGSVSVNKEL